LPQPQDLRPERGIYSPPLEAKCGAVVALDGKSATGALNASQSVNYVVNARTESNRLVRFAHADGFCKIKPPIEPFLVGHQFG
jgi:hypothetical protein